MPSTTSVETCWFALAFIAFFQICIYQKHKQHNILFFGSFFTLSSVAKKKKRTTISCSIRQNEYNHQLCDKCQVENHQKRSHSLEVESEKIRWQWTQ
jgi:uncharacterized paraquat-inducible protein A